MEIRADRPNVSMSQSNILAALLRNFSRFLSFILPRKLQLVVSGRWEDKRYKNVDSFFALKRQDTKYFLSLSASRPLFYDWLSVILDYNYTFNDSNITDYEYDKHEATLSLAARYYPIDSQKNIAVSCHLLEIAPS